MVEGKSNIYRYPEQAPKGRIIRLPELVFYQLFI